MNVYHTFFSDSANLYCDNGGFDTRTALYACVENGDTKGLPSVLEQYLKLLRAHINNDFDYGQISVLYVFAQLQLVAIYAGVPVRNCHSIQEAYYKGMDLAKTVDSLLLLLSNQCYDFAVLIKEIKSSNKFSPDVKACCDYIREHLYTRIRLADVASAVHMSPGYISKKFQAETGTSINQYIRQEKIREAKMLLNTKMTILDVAVNLAFASQSHFSDYFKKETGMTPLQYKKLHDEL